MWNYLPKGTHVSTFSFILPSCSLEWVYGGLHMGPSTKLHTTALQTHPCCFERQKVVSHCCFTLHLLFLFWFLLHKYWFIVETLENMYWQKLGVAERNEDIGPHKNQLFNSFIRSSKIGNNPHILQHEVNWSTTCGFSSWWMTTKD